MSKKFSEKLREIRKGQKKTLEDLATAVGSSKAYIWQLENKLNARPSAEMLLNIANYFNVAPEFLIDDKQHKPSENQIENAFFRKFQKLSENDKRIIEQMISGLNDKE